MFHDVLNKININLLAKFLKSSNLYWFNRTNLEHISCFQKYRKLKYAKNQQLFRQKHNTSNNAMHWYLAETV